MSDIDVAKYIRDLTRSGCRLTIQPKPELHAVEVLAERLSPGPVDGHPVPTQSFVQMVTIRELDLATIPGYPIAVAVQMCARRLAESV